MTDHLDYTASFLSDSFEIEEEDSGDYWYQMGRDLFDYLGARGFIVIKETPADAQLRTAEEIAHERADKRREEMKTLRMPTAETYELTTPITTAPSPLVSDNCSRCKEPIGETESWRPDPDVEHFAKAHRRCL